MVTFKYEQNCETNMGKTMRTIVGTGLLTLASLGCLNGCSEVYKEISNVSDEIGITNKKGVKIAQGTHRKYLEDGSVMFHVDMNGDLPYYVKGLCSQGSIDKLDVCDLGEWCKRFFSWSPATYKPAKYNWEGIGKYSVLYLKK